MTSPTVVGSVAVEVTASARGFAKALRDAVVAEFKGAGIDKAISEALGKRKFKVPVEPEFKDKPRTSPTDPSTQTPKAPRRLPGSDDPDLLLRAFQQDVQRQLRNLARQAVTIPLHPDTDALRRDLGAALAEVQKTAKAKVPVEPAARQDYERSLQRMLDDVAGKVKLSLPAPQVKPPKPVKVPVQVDPVLTAFQQGVRREVAALSRQVQAQIPVDANTAGLRQRLAAQLAEIQRQTRIQVPTEPGARAAYEARIRAMLTAVQRSIPPVQADVRANIDRSSFRAATSAFSGLASAARGVGGAVGVLAGVGAVAGAGAAGLAGLASAAGGAVQLLAGLASVAATASGALFALPGAAAVAAAGVGALAIGFVGVASAIKESGKAAASGGGGGSVINTARQIAQAQRGVAAAERGLQAAQRESRRAQEELNRARKAAVERIEDLARSLRGARLDEREAALRLRDAQEDLLRAQESGDPREIERAQLAYEQAALALEDAKDAAADLADENADAAKRGVEGSDEVRAALDRQQAAADSLASATDALASAQESLAAAQEKVGAGGGGVDRFAEAMAKLAPAAQEVVRTLIALRPAWEAVQRSVQQALFTGIAADLTRLSASILPTAQAGFVGIAEVINGQVRAALDELATSNTRVQLDRIFVNAKRAIDNLTVAVRPLTRALLDVSAVGSDVVGDLTEGFGEWVRDVAERLSELAESGALRAMIDNGLAMLKQLGAAAADVGGIVKGIFTAAGADGGGGVFALLDRLNELVNSTAGQSALGELFTSLAEIGQALTPVLLAVAQALGPVAGAIGRVAEAFAPTLVDLVGSLGSALVALEPAVVALAPLVDTLAVGLQPLAQIISGLVTSAAPGLNAFLQGLVRGLQVLVPVAPVVGQAIGDLMTALAPLIPMLAQGLANALIVVAPLLSLLSRYLGPLINQLSGALVGAMQELMPVLIEFGQQMLPVAAAAGIALSKALAPLAPVLVKFASVLAGQLVVYLPQFAAVAAQLLPIVAQLAAELGVVLLDALNALLPYLPDLISAGLELALAFTQLLPVILPLIPPLVQIGLMALQAALNSGALELALKLMTAAVNGATRVVRTASGVIQAMTHPLDTARDAARRMGTAVRDGAQGALDAVRSLPGRITSALGDMGRLLFDAGRNVVSGLIDGIRSMFGSLGNAAGDMAQTIRDYLPFSPAKEGPLSGSGNPYNSGQSIAKLLASGVKSRLSHVEASAAALAAPYQLAIDPLAGLSTLDVPAVDGADGDPIPVEIPIYIGDEVVRVVRTEISSSNRGIRRRVKAGSGLAYG